MVFNSSITPFKRFSKSPRYFVPASIEPKSRAYSGESCKILGTLFSEILMAKPSAIAVLPTPGSPTKRGLFFFRLHRVCTTLSISSSRPITGSIFPSFATTTKSIAYLDKKLSSSEEVSVELIF